MLKNFAVNTQTDALGHTRFVDTASACFQSSPHLLQVSADHTLLVCHVPS